MHPQLLPIAADHEARSDVGRDRLLPIGVRRPQVPKVSRRAHPGPAGTELAAHRIAEELQRLHIP